MFNLICHKISEKVEDCISLETVYNPLLLSTCKYLNAHIYGYYHKHTHTQEFNILYNYVAHIFRQNKGIN